MTRTWKDTGMQNHSCLVRGRPASIPICCKFWQHTDDCTGKVMVLSCSSLARAQITAGSNLHFVEHVWKRCRWWTEHWNGSIFSLLSRAWFVEAHWRGKEETCSLCMLCSCAVSPGGILELLCRREEFPRNLFYRIVDYFPFFSASLFGSIVNSLSLCGWVWW